MKLVPVVAAVATASIASMVNAQCGTGGSCFEIHGPYCNDADCCNAVCGVDPYCCNNSWDGFCVQEANELCLGCGNPGTGSCYATGGPYCNDAECCDYICSIDPFCCNVSWDSLCVQKAVTNCATCGGPASGDCFTPGGPACNDETCCSTVCGADPYCCNTAWDEFCVTEAYDYCVCGGELTGSCYETHGPFCDDATCCETVCASDPFCCEVAWDTLCVEDAYGRCGCGGELTGSCFQSHSTPWCSDDYCCETVCAFDTYCCNVAWDSLCVTQAFANCSCGGVETHSCFAPGGPYCNDAACCNLVCDIDPYCCNVTWDSTCVTEANNYCLGCGGVSTGSCFETHGPFCNDEDCCNTVCAVDGYCCNVSWDAACVNEATQMCLTGYCGAPNSHSCFVPGDAYCNDASCCNTVCAIDPYCCNNNWDSLCVTEAFINCLGCGDPATGSCYATHGPACDDWGCCQMVCSVDMFCCDVQWDSYCVTEAIQICGGPPCPADLDGDGVVGPADLATLLGAWSTPFADLNGDGITGAADLAMLLGEWGPC